MEQLQSSYTADNANNVRESNVAWHCLPGHDLSLLYGHAVHSDEKSVQMGKRGADGRGAQAKQSFVAIKLQELLYQIGEA